MALKSCLVYFLVLVLSTSTVAQTTDYACQGTGYFCYAQDPNTFYYCGYGRLYTYTCPDGLFFSMKDGFCNWPEFTDCNGQQTIYTTTTDYSIVEPTYNPTDFPVFPTYNPTYFPVDAPTDDEAPISKPASSKQWWARGTDITQWQALFNKDKPSREEAGGTSTDEEKKTPRKRRKYRNPRRKGSRYGPNSRSKYHKGRRRPPYYNRRRYSGDCNPATCQLPSCFCPGTSIPQGLSPSSVPQMVMLTFDDEVSSEYTAFYERLFRPGRFNPNGCRIRGGAFVSGSGTDYSLVNPLRNKGVEIGVHSITHRFPSSWWASASYDELVNEAVGMRNNLINDAKVPSADIIGYRSPFLELAGDNLYGALYNNGFTYDSSMFSSSEEYNEVPVWPFTLDYALEESYCQYSNCPTKSYPGLWEIPIQGWNAPNGQTCSMPDGCGEMTDAQETLQYFQDNFGRYYNNNRAPLGIFIHARWFNAQAHNIEGLDQFLDYLLSLQDVYIVTPTQVVEWMRNPTPLSEINNFAPWSC